MTWKRVGRYLLIALISAGIAVLVEGWSKLSGILTFFGGLLLVFVVADLVAHFRKKNAAAP